MRTSNHPVALTIYGSGDARYTTLAPTACWRACKAWSVHVLDSTCHLQHDVVFSVPSSLVEEQQSIDLPVTPLITAEVVGRRDVSYAILSVDIRYGIPIEQSTNQLAGVSFLPPLASQYVRSPSLSNHRTSDGLRVRHFPQQFQFCNTTVAGAGKYGLSQEERSVTCNKN